MIQRRTAPSRRLSTLRSLALLATLLAVVYVLLQEGGGGGGPQSGGGRGAPPGGRPAPAGGGGGGAPRRDPRLPSGVTSLYPPLPPGAASPFSEGVTRIVVTFIGAHMNAWYTACLRALILQHCGAPHVRVLVWANELPDSFVDAALGDVVGARPPRLHLVRYNLTALAAGAPAAPETLDFVVNPPVGGDGVGVQPSMEPQVRMAHVTDVLRMVVLWRFGGVYLDADILPLRPLHELGNVYAANLGNYECTKALYPGWPGGEPIAMPPRLGGATVSCMCVCFLSFPAPRHPLVEGVLTRGLEAFKARDCVYGGLGAWVAMDVIRDLVARGDPAFDARPVSVSSALCWPQVLDAVPPQSEEAVDAIMRDCASVHMMGGAHAKKFAQTSIGNDTLFGQVYTRLRLPARCPEGGG
jgi:hypothetical protein